MFGVFDTPDAASVVALGLHALQHRGEEACGIASFDGQGFHTERHMGHVAEAFSGGDLAERLPGRSAIGHTRYSTAGASVLRNVQPMFADLEAGGVALAHNGNLTNFLTLRERLVSEGHIFQSTSDSEVIIHLIAMSRKRQVHRPLHRRAEPDRGRLRPGGADQQEADRRARPARHPPAGAGRPERQAGAGLRDPGARHGRRDVRARRRARRDRGDLRRRRRDRSSRSPPRRPGPASSSTSTSPCRTRW